MPEKRVKVVANIRGTVRREVFQGREHLVVPATLVRSQVLSNNLGRTFLPAEDISDGWAQLSNGSPVVSDHPNTSARSPEILNQMGVGGVYRVRAENGSLKAEVYLDPARSAAVADLARIIEKLDRGEKVELSTSFPVSVEETPGVHNGKPYERVIHPTAGLDHLAVFAEKTGACSVTDGCGLAQNHDGPCDDEVENEEESLEAKSWLDRVLGKFKDVLASEVPDGALATHGEEGESEPASAGINSPEGGDDTMKREKMIAELAAAGTDEDALNKLSDCQLKALLGGDGAQNELPPERPDDSEALRLAHQYRRENEELKAKYESAHQAQQKERAEMLDDLLYNVDALPYTTAEVQAMDIVEMRKVHRLAFPKRADFSGRGAPVAQVGSFDWVRPIDATRSEQEVH